MENRSQALSLATSLFALAAIGIPSTAWAGSVRVLAAGNSTTGSVFYGRALVEANGKVYVTATDGATSGYGSVIELTPPAAGKTAWTETVIHRFAGLPKDGQNPQGGVIEGKAGVLYGTTNGAGANNQGVVYRLTPPAAGQRVWQEAILYSFGAKAHDASISRAPLVLDAKGNLYGTTTYGGTSKLCGETGCGTVFKLAPPAAGKTAWTETVLHSFGATAKDGTLPETSGLILNAKGEIFGTTGNGGTYGAGTAFKLTPPAASKTAWTETVLTNFGSNGGSNDGGATGGLVFGKTGALYGALAGGGAGNGSVYELTPPASGNGAWKQTQLYAFNSFDDCMHPQATLVVDKAGDLWGTAQYGGKIPPSRQAAGCVFSIKPSGASSKETIVYTLSGPTNGVLTLGAEPWAAVTPDAKGNLFATTITGGVHSLGTVFELSGVGFEK